MRYLTLNEYLQQSLPFVLVNHCPRIQHLPRVLVSLGFEVQNLVFLLLPSVISKYSPLNHFVFNLFCLENPALFLQLKVIATMYATLKFLKSFLYSWETRVNFSVFDKVKLPREPTLIQEPGCLGSYATSLLTTHFVVSGRWLNYLPVPQLPHVKSGIITVPTSKDCCESRIRLHVKAHCK